MAWTAPGVQQAFRLLKPNASALAELVWGNRHQRLVNRVFQRVTGFEARNFRSSDLDGGPVRGLRPSRAARAFTAKVPKPTKVTFSPLFNAVDMMVVRASSARPAVDFGRSAELVMASTRSFLFMYDSFCWLNGDE
jgi:hypothetical protein